MAAANMCRGAPAPARTFPALSPARPEHASKGGAVPGLWALIDGVGHVPGWIVLVREGRWLHVEFNASPEQREAITRKLSSGRYARSVTRMNAVRLAATVVRRAAT